MWRILVAMGWALAKIGLCIGALYVVVRFANIIGAWIFPR